MTETEEIKVPGAVLAGLDLGRDSEFEVSMDELGELVQAAGMTVKGRVVQSLSAPVAATYIGSGKLEELRGLTRSVRADYCIFEDSLSPAQMKNISDAIDLPVMDRTGLILEIFSRRAKTREARLQVEMAQLQYMLPRLIGMRSSLGRQGGTGGSMSNKGAGETQLELDRRRIEKRISELRRELDLIEHDRDVQRKKRSRAGLPRVALVGYTNAGKSTLMNALLTRFGAEEEKKVLSQDMLFATLDTTVRRISPGDNRDFLLSDTVGFINRLPHGLIKAFRSTLEEACTADLLLQVADVSDPHLEQQLRVTADTLKELGADSIPRITILNKADRVYELSALPRVEEGKICMSAALNVGLDELLTLIDGEVRKGNREVSFLIPYTDGRAVHDIAENATVLEQEYRAEGVMIRADCSPEIAGRYAGYETAE